MNQTTEPSVNVQAQSAVDSEVDQVNAPDKLVPVSEAIRYRKRAQTAEQQLEQLNEQVRVMNAKLQEAGQTISSLERRQQVDALLMDADAIDLEAARLLTEQAVLQMDEPDVKMAVDDLRRYKPYLFRRRHEAELSAMSPAVPSNGHDPAEEAAEHAAITGDRRDLLRYLRLRRAR